MSSYAASSSTTSFAPSRASSAPQPKDYSAAFASLQSMYGLGGTAPSISPKTSRAKAPKPAPAAAADGPTAQKDYQRAFGALSAQLGFSGVAPAAKSLHV
ncbi:hypothetical protein FB451DRAFT_1556671 [Mycena latifolia]|nr:hypothetical protein FB451DRAFT_1556671 [Mycena latifolia]